MPRLPRLHVSGGCYHVILRGNHREDIFVDAEDRYALNGIVAESMQRYGARSLGFCWMTNHLHALVQIADQPLGKVMQRIAARYSRHRHKQLGTTGHLFERRYRAWLVDTDQYIVALLRYIHRNPVEAGIVKSVKDYPWSSHRAYLGLESFNWLNVEFGLGLFGKTMAVARQHYEMLMNQESYASEARILEDAHPDDPRVLGGDRFLASLAPPKIRPRRCCTLDQLAEKICAEHGVSVESAKSTSRDRLLSRVRKEIAKQALEGRVASLHQIARFLGRSPPAICQLLQRHRNG
jgi:putative transposase